MYLKRVDGPRQITLPDGSILSRADLPPPDTRRWVASRKAVVVKAVVHGLISRDEALGRKINSAVFPGLQVGPLMHVIAGKDAGLGEALRPGFRVYANQIVANAQALSGALVERGFDIVSGGTDTHLMLVDLRSKKKSIAVRSYRGRGVGIRSYKPPPRAW